MHHPLGDHWVRLSLSVNPPQKPQISSVPGPVSEPSRPCGLVQEYVHIPAFLVLLGAGLAGFEIGRRTSRKD